MTNEIYNKQLMDNPILVAFNGMVANHIPPLHQNKRQRPEIASTLQKLYCRSHQHKTIVTQVIIIIHQDNKYYSVE